MKQIEEFQWKSPFPQNRTTTTTTTNQKSRTIFQIKFAIQTRRMLLDGNTNTNRNKQTNGKNCTAKSSGVNVYPSYMACNKCDISDNPNENENNMRRSFPHRYHTRVESRCGNMNTAPKWKLGKATTVPVDGLSENWVVRCDIGWLKPSLVMVIIYAAYGGASLIFSIANA